MTMSYRVLKGSTNVSVTIRIIDSTDGTPETAVEHNTAGMAMEYRREGAVSTAITEVALAALTTAHTDGGIEHIGNGYYRFDVPDLAFATGVTGVLIHGTVTGMVVIGAYCHLVDVDDQDAVRMGLTALPNAAADAAGGLPISDAGGLDLDTKLANTNEVTAARMGALTDWIDGGRLDLLLDAILLDTGTTLDGKIDTIDGIVDAILLDTAEIGAAGAGLTEAGGTGDQFTAIPWNAAWDAEVESEVNDALVAIHLDHLLAADYDPAIKPGIATALLNELVESDVGVSRFTANALEQGPDTTTGLSLAADQSGVTIGTVTTNSDMRGTDSALLAASAPANFGDLSITATTGLVDITQVAADKAWGTTVRVLTAGTNIALAKGVGVTGFNDLSAAQVNAEADTALADYDPPTNAEMVARTIAAANYATASALAAVLPPKNTALSNIEFLMVDSADHVTPKTGLTVTGQRSIDGGAFGAVSGAFAEVSNGIYQFDALAADMNGDIITFRFSSAGADDTFLTIKTGA